MTSCRWITVLQGDSRVEMAMTHLNNLLHAIHLHPEDDALRLVLSDWLEEQGQTERAEFIRVQVECARLPDDPRQVELTAREHELLVRRHQDWLGELPRRCENWQFRRGLLHLTMSAAAFVAAQVDGLEDEQAAEWVDEVRVKGLTPRAIGGWSALPFPHLAALDLSDNGLKLAGARALAASALVAGLVALNLDKNNFGNKGVQALAASPHLANLRSLRLGHNRLGTEGICALAASPLHLGRLESLDLEWNSAGWAGLAALLTSPHLPCLAHLSLKYNAHTHQKGIAPLPAPPHPPSLTDLNVMGNHLGPKGAAALAASPALSRLTRLDLSCNYIGDEGLAALARSPHLARLTQLDLYADSIDEKGVAALAASSYLTNLTSLNLGRWGPPRSSMAIRTLTCWSGLARLTSLDVGVDEEGAVALASSPNTKNLTRLNLHPGWAQDAGAVALASSPFLGNLFFLDLGRNGVGETGALALARSTSLAGLRRLSLKGNMIGQKAALALRQRFGDEVELGEEE